MVGGSGTLRHLALTVRSVRALSTEYEPVRGGGTVTSDGNPLNGRCEQTMWREEQNIINW